jgi:hypothetical protein
MHFRWVVSFVVRRVPGWREWWFARQAGRAALVLYQRIRSERPELTPRALYEAFVCQRNGIAESAAKSILRHAEDSFATWPRGRDLILRDVVQYLVISEYLLSNPERVGTTINMTRVVGKIIPDEF